MDEEAQRAIERIDGNIEKIFTLLSTDGKDLAGIKIKVNFHDKIATGVIGTVFSVLAAGIIKLVLF